MGPTGFLGAGSFSMPTTVIGGEQLTANPAQFSGYTCTQVVASGDSASFVYRGDGPNGTKLWYTLDLEPTNADIGQISMVIDPYRVGAATTGVYFLCYCSGCKDNSGYVPTDYTSSYSGESSMFKSTIIGGGGLNA